MPTRSSHKELFRNPTAKDKLTLFQSLLDARDDLTVDLAFALLKTIHQELSSDQTRDRTVYKQYAEEIEALRSRVPGALQQVVAIWKAHRNTSPAEWFSGGNLRDG